MFGTLLAYRLKPPANPNDASLLVKKLYGQQTSSHGGRYRYRRKGLLDKVPAQRLIRGVIIVRSEDEPQVTELLENFEMEIHVRNVLLTQDDIITLDLKRDGKLD